MSFGVTLLARTDVRRRSAEVRELRRREGHARLHDGPEDARHRLEGSRHPRAVLRRRVGARRPPGRRSGAGARPVPAARSRSGASRSPRLSLSLTQAVLDLALDYAKQRVQFGQPISKFQAVQFKLADIATELEAARWLTYRAASLRDAGQPFLKEAAMAKLKASRVAAWAASEAVQIHGGRRLHARVAGGPLLLRLEGARDRRGHQRDPAPRHRPRAWAADLHRRPAGECASAMSSRSGSHARSSSGA